MAISITTKKGVKMNEKYIVPCVYDDIIPARVNGTESNELFITQSNDMFGLVKVDPKTMDKTIRECDYDMIGEFDNDVAIICIHDERFGKKYSIVDTDLNVKNLFEYQNVTRLSSELFEVTKDGKVGIIDKYGNVIISCEFSKISYYESAKKIEIEV